MMEVKFHLWEMDFQKLRSGMYMLMMSTQYT